MLQSLQCALMLRPQIFWLRTRASCCKAAGCWLLHCSMSWDAPDHHADAVLTSYAALLMHYSHHCVCTMLHWCSRRLTPGLCCAYCGTSPGCGCLRAVARAVVVALSWSELWLSQGQYGGGGDGWCCRTAERLWSGVRRAAATTCTRSASTFGLPPSAAMRRP
jgi:hypothetical protein